MSLDFLNGGGEMGARMRAFDWTSTPLGPPSEWPQSLKTVVRLMLDSRFAMWMAWGEQGSFFCNDAYLPTLGLKRDWALGARADRVWAEIWSDIGPRIEHVFATGRATWDEGLRLFLQRSGYVEETFHTFSYSPVHDDFNAVRGMLCVVVEDTERVIGERRLALLRELAALPAVAGETLAECGARLLASIDTRAADLPFAALYLAEADGPGSLGAWTPTLAACAAAGTLDAGTGVLPVAAALGSAGERLLDDVERRLGPVIGPWPEPVQQALLLPLTGAGQASPIGVLLLGISTRRGLDAGYRSFLSLAAAQIASRLADTQARLEERQRAEALAELDRAKNVFFGNVSHEFRTPLTLMLGPIEDLLARRAALAPGDAEALDMALRNGLRLRKLVNSLLDFSRIEAGRVEARYRPTDLAALTTDLAAVFRAAVEKAGLRLVVDCPALPEPVWVDRDMWEKVVLNLLSNAFKHTFVGEIRVSLLAGGGAVRLEVADTGIGIEPDALPRVFDRFHRVAGARSRSQEGTGIGLALVKELVRLHGGRVEATSVPGHGSRFAVELPRGSAHLPFERIAGPTVPADTPVDPESFVDDALRGVSDVVAAPLGGEAEVPAPAGRARVLVVDDNADMRGYIRRLLSPRWEVETAADGLQALHAVQAAPTALVITDVMMPELDGYGLLRRLRADPATRTLPVIVLSAQAGEEARVAGLGHGADDYLVKPFSARELLARVEVQLMRGRMQAVQEALNRRMADVFRNAPVGLALLGAGRRIEVANPQFGRLAPGVAIAGRPLREAIATLDGRDIDALLDEVEASGHAHLARAQRLAPSAATDGGPADSEPAAARFFDVVLQPLPDEPQHAAALAVVCVEVTDLIVARETAEAASRSKDDFLAMLGHELRNPLAPISTALQLMKMRGVAAIEAEWSIIDRQLHHMVRLVDDLLDVSRIAGGKIELRRHVFELHRAVELAVETASPLFERARHTLTVDVPAAGCRVEADLTRLAQVISNLLTNAARYTPPEGRVELTATVVGDAVVLVVKDNGVGMTPETLAGVFEMFVQAPQGVERAQGGLGLGLTIARSLTRLHGGELTAASEGPGRGSCFTLRLPLAPAQAEVHFRAPEAPAEPAGITGRRIVVVDDNVDAAQSLATLLELAGHEVRCSYDALAALQLVESFEPDTAIIDIGLPVMDGFELARRLRTLPGLQALRIVAVSGYGSATDRERSEDAGIDAHLVKPVDYGRLRELLSH